jgi:hypothetical protein
MKTKNGLSYRQIALIGLGTELTLIIVQLIYLSLYARDNANGVMDLSSEYMKTRGFYIFQIIGFFLYTTVVYVILRKITDKILNKVLLLIVIGGITELTFYLVMRASYEGAFLYSILDKVIAVFFALILYNYTTKKVKRPDSYV